MSSLVPPGVQRMAGLLAEKFDEYDSVCRGASGRDKRINHSNVTTDTLPRHEHFKDRSCCAPRDVSAGHMTPCPARCALLQHSFLPKLPADAIKCTHPNPL